jgi:signal peptidase I
MYPVLEAGDYIVVSKLIPGARVYSHFPYTKDANGKVATHRFRGIRTIKRNDIMVFNKPDTKKDIEPNIGSYYVKRCVALPGDAFMIEDGIYKVMNAPDIAVGNQANQKIMSERLCFSKNIAQLFPFDTAYFKWTMKRFGPFYIPKKGDRLSVDTLNCLLYKKLIAYETGKPVEIRESKVFLGDSIILDYMFLQNYYFMAGDYVFASQDSRYYGLVPEEFIIGKAVMVSGSKDMKTGKWRWERFLNILE